MELLILLFSVPKLDTDSMPQNMESSTKIDEVMKILERNKDKKIVVVAEYKQELFVVEHFMRKSQDVGKLYWLTGMHCNVFPKTKQVRFKIDLG